MSRIPASSTLFDYTTILPSPFRISQLFFQLHFSGTRKTKCIQCPIASYAQCNDEAKYGSPIVAALAIFEENTKVSTPFRISQLFFQLHFSGTRKTKCIQCPIASYAQCNDEFI